MKPRPRAAWTCALALSALLCSCVGVDARASVGPDGSGVLALVYSISRMAAPIGSLGTAGRVLPFPVSREDFDRASAGIEGLTVSSYSREEGADEVTIRATLAFSSPAVLASFLDPTGKRAIYSEEGGRRSLRLVVAAGVAALDPDLSRFMDAAFSSYRVSLSLELPSSAISADLAPAVGVAAVRGARVEYSGDTVALAKSAQPVIWEIVW